MRRVLQVLSWVALASTVAPPVLFATDWITLGQMKYSMLAATIAWFVFTPLWMGRETTPHTVDT